MVGLGYNGELIGDFETGSGLDLSEIAHLSFAKDLLVVIRMLLRNKAHLLPLKETYLLLLDFERVKVLAHFVELRHPSVICQKLQVALAYLLDLATVLS